MLDQNSSQGPLCRPSQSKYIVRDISVQEHKTILKALKFPRRAVQCEMEEVWKYHDPSYSKMSLAL